jgi:ABC-type transport system substrate-binding protein
MPSPLTCWMPSFSLSPQPRPPRARPTSRGPARWTTTLAALLALASLPTLAMGQADASTTSPPAAAQEAASTPPASGAPKVLRYAFQIAETGFDPAQISDLYSRTLAAHIFEAPLTYDFLAQPAKVRPNTAVALPEVSDDHKRFVFTIRPGIYFADDPAFKGQRRELVAADYVYSLKRLYDPALKSPNLFQFENVKVLGLSELRKRALDTGQPFDYDTEVAGLRALDRYRFEIRLAQSSPRFPYTLADNAVGGALAREVVEAYAGRIMEHPVGTGPYRLAEWRRSSRIVLERNPGYRDVRYAMDTQGADARSRAIAKKLEGRRLPMIDRVEVSIIEEAQPRWLGFLKGEQNMLERLPAEFASIAVPNGKLAPNLAKQGIVMERVVHVSAALYLFNLEHPVIGGYSPERVALRRAIALGYNLPMEEALVYQGQIVAGQSILPPQVSGFDPAFHSEMSEYDPARAAALLDLYGYVDRDGDGWREQPDGARLELVMATQPDQASRKADEVWQRSMSALGVRARFEPAKWPENLKASRAGRLMMWGVGWSAVSPDGSYMLDLLYGPNKGQANHARMNLAALNALYEEQKRLPDGAEREAVIAKIKKLSVAYMPYKVSGHRLFTDLMQPEVIGYRRHPFMRDFWQYLDIDAEASLAAD